MNTEFKRRSKMAGMPDGECIPLRWMWIVNEIIPIINGLRKESSFKINEPAIATIAGLSDIHRLAICMEYAYIREQCQLYYIEFDTDNNTPNAVLPSAEFTPELSYEPVDITIKLKIFQ